MKEWPKTNSDSSAETSSMKVPNYGTSADRITEPPISTPKNPMGPDPVNVTHEVKYAEYENDKRMTEDFSLASDNSDKTAGFDGTDTMMPESDDNRSDIDTSYSIKS